MRFVRKDMIVLALMAGCGAMAVCTLLHVKGDGICGGLADGLQNQPNKKGKTK